MGGVAADLEGDVDRATAFAETVGGAVGPLVADLQRFEGKEPREEGLDAFAVARRINGRPTATTFAEGTA